MDLVNEIKQIENIETISALENKTTNLLAKYLNLSTNEKGKQAIAYINLFTMISAQIGTCINYDADDEKQVAKRIFIDYAETLDANMHNMPHYFDQTTRLTELTSLIESFNEIARLISNLSLLY